MASVKLRIESIKQPRGGYIKRKDFETFCIDEKSELCEKENIHSSIVGLAVDYLLRYLLGEPKEKAFEISMQGAEIIKDEKRALSYFNNIKGLDDTSIINACRLVAYDVVYRAGRNEYVPSEYVMPDDNTISHIAIMVQRGLTFFQKYGPVVKCGFSFPKAYTGLVSSGDADYLTRDTLWDIKTIKKEIEPRHSLQLLVYYLMGKKSMQEVFENVTKLGVVNVRLNKVYVINVQDIPKEVIEEVSHTVIGYGMTPMERETETIKQDEYIKKVYGKSDLDRETYGCSRKKDYVTHALPAKIPVTENLKIRPDSPVFWSGNEIPEIVERMGYFYIVRIRARFSIRDGQEPFVMIKHFAFFDPYERNVPLATSNLIVNGKIMTKYKDRNNNIVEAMPTLTLTKDDFLLFKERYDITQLQILDGCYYLREEMQEGT